MGKRVGIQLCYPFEEKRLATWEPPFICQPKLDGERCRALLNCGQVLLLSSESNQIVSVPAIHESLVNLSLKLNKPVELDGELYTHGMSFEEVHSIVGRTVNLNPEHEKINFNVFDMVYDSNQSNRILNLKRISEYFPDNIQMVKTDLAFTVEEVREFFNHYVSLDYEGIIIRHFQASYFRRRSPFMMKFKPKKSDIYPIVGFIEGTGKYKGTIGAIICETDGDQFEVGSFSLTDEERMKLWNKRFTLTSFDCKVGYQHKWTSGKPKSGVFLELVERAPNVKFDNPLEGI